MATSGSTTDASDEHFDFSCTTCYKKGKNSEAVEYCVDCQEYFCRTCVDNHNSFSVLAGHTLVGRSKFGRLSGLDSKNLPSVPTERCQLHPLKLIDMYCADHDTVGCHVCFTINHKFCQDIHYIPEYIQNNSQTEVPMNEVELERARSEMDFVLKKTEDAIKGNKKQRTKFLADIRQFRKEINDVLDGLEQASVNELDSKFRSLDEDYSRYLKMIQDAIEKLITRKTEIESSKRNPSQQFVNLKMSERILTEIYKGESEMLTNQGNSFTVERNSDLLYFLKNLKALVNIPSQKLELFKVSNKTTHNVTMASEVGCNIWSSCVLDSGDILLTDFRNDNIKLVDNVNYNVKDSMKLAFGPTSVCNVTNVEAVVCLTNKTVRFVSTKNKLTNTRELKLDHSCRGIAVLDGQLVIGNDGDKIYIYTMNGERLKIIENDQTGHKLFSHIRELCVSDNRKMVHIVDRDNGVKTIDRDGNVKWEYTYQMFKHPWGICTDGKGHVFVSGYDSQNVIQIGPNGKSLGDIVSQKHKIKRPKAICFDKKQNKLIIEQDNELHVFKLQ